MGFLVRLNVLFGLGPFSYIKRSVELNLSYRCSILEIRVADTGCYTDFFSFRRCYLNIIVRWVDC